MARAITGRITLNLVAGIVITVVTVTATLFWMAAKHDEQAAAGTQTMVEGGVQAMAKRMAQLANDYGWWEEAYDAYQRHDKEWVDANMGTGITDTAISDLLFIVSPTGTVDYKWLIDGAPDNLDAILTPNRVEAIKQIADGMKVDNFAGVSQIYMDTPSDPMMLSIQHITPVSKADKVKASDLPVIVFGQYLNHKRLHDLGSSFLIDDLNFVRGTSAPAHGMPVTNLVGRTLGYLAWTPPRPGDAILRQVSVPVGVALALFCLVTLATAFRARRIAIALTKSEKEASTAARTDSLTGLMNRHGFRELIESDACVAASRFGELAIIYLDVNGFKAVNDSVGHHGGDEMVRALALRIAAATPAGTSLARIGGDEFAVALFGPDADASARRVARAIGAAIDRPFTICGFEFHVTASVGYAVASEIGLIPSDLIRRADLAMYQAKNGAERDALAYDATMETGARAKKEIEAGLRHAIEAGKLEVYYQPIVSSTAGEIVGLEALVRWTDPDRGSVSPALFIPVAEETGLIQDIGRFVINRAAADLHRWPGLHMSINVSPVQLRDPGFADEIRQIITASGHEPSRFHLELTEGILVNNPTIAERKLKKLKEFGFVLALDDFGTGFSSIGYLSRFPFDVLKIDRSFVCDIGASAEANTLMQSLVSLGEALHLKVVVEGIEKEEQMRLLRLMRCDMAQGYLFSRPVPAAEIDALLVAAAEVARVGGGEIVLQRRAAAHA